MTTRGVARRGFLAGGFGLFACAGCAPTVTEATQAGSSASRRAGRSSRRGALDSLGLCGEGLSPEQLSAIIGHGSGQEAAQPAVRVASGRQASQAPVERKCVYEYPIQRPRVRITYWPDHHADRAPEDTARRSGRPANACDHPRHVIDAALAAINAMDIFRDASFPAPYIHPAGPLQIELKNIRPFRGFTGPTINAITIERTLRGAEQAETIAHEIFHRIQYRFNRTPFNAFEPGADDRTLFLPMIREGGARLAEIMVVRSSQRYEHDAQDWFMGGSYSLMRNQRGRRRGYVGASYQAGLFWKYVAEQHGTLPANGRVVPGRREAETQLAVLEAIRSAKLDDVHHPTIAHLRNARRSMRGDGEFDQFQYLPGVTDTPVCSETTWGNFQVALALNGTAGGDARFRFEDATQWRGVTAGRQAIPASRQVAFNDLPSAFPFPISSSDPTPNANGPSSGWGRFGPDMILDDMLREEIVDLRFQLRDFLGIRPAAVPDEDKPGILPVMLDGYSMMAFKVVMPAGRATRLMRVEWTPVTGLNDALVQIISLDTAGELQDLYRHDGAQSRPLNRVFAFAAVSEVIILVGSRTSAGNFELRLSRPADQPVLMAATCNGRSGRFLTNNANRSAFDWQSPDVRILEFRDERIISVLIVNRGTVEARDLEVLCFSAPLTRLPSTSINWVTAPIRDTQKSLVTDDECARLERETPLGIALEGKDLPAPCFFPDEVFNSPSSPGNPGLFQFTLRAGDPHDVALRIEAKARGATEIPLVIHAIFTRGKPPLVLL